MKTVYDLDRNLRITAQDCQNAGHCGPEIYPWFEAHGFDCQTVRKHGVTVGEMLDTKDGHAIQVVERTYRNLLDG